MNHALELIVRQEGDELQLLAPSPGLFTLALPAGALLSSGANAGVLRVLNLEYKLQVPNGAVGRVISNRPERVQQPVGYHEVLYRLTTLADAGAEEQSAPGSDAANSASGLVLPSPQSGRFYHRPSPGEPPLAEVGSELAAGDAIGLIEVMKTFAHVTYQAQAGLPQRARVVRMIAEDGAEVRQGDPLVEVEPA